MKISRYKKIFFSLCAKTHNVGIFVIGTAEKKKRKELLVRFRLPDDPDRVDIFCLWRTFAATATTRLVIFEAIRIHFFCQSLSIQSRKQVEETITYPILEGVRGSVTVKDTD